MQEFEESKPTLTDAELLRDPIIKIRGLSGSIDMVRSTWLVTDEKVSNWKGLGPGTGGFEKLSKYEREPLIGQIDLLGSDFMRALPHLSEDLCRDIIELQEMFRRSSTPLETWTDDLDAKAHKIRVLLKAEVGRLENTTPVDRVNGDNGQSSLSTEDSRTARWYFKATDGRLTADTLRHAIDRKVDPIKGSKVDTRWYYTIASVCREWPEHKKQIQAYLDSENQEAKREIKRK